MTRLKDIVAVSLAGRSYEIAIGAGLLREAGLHLRKYLARPRLVVITDENVERLHFGELLESLGSAGIESRAITLAAGEAAKSFDRLSQLCESLLEMGVERNDTVVAFGGGVIGDLVGFAAAILRRGVSFVQLPTTLLAQVDSSVGGKTGINTPQGKNLVGAFHQPVFVLADIGLLHTLPDREFRAGYAEVVKYALLGDSAFYAWLESNADALSRRDVNALLHAVKVCCAAKASIVAADETEQGERALLNLGHTFAHALEAATGFSSRLLHGEAVAIGLGMAFRFSTSLGLCSKADSDQVCQHLRAAGLPASAADAKVRLPSGDALLDLMRQDKKARSGRLTLILVRGIGKAFIAKDIDEQKLSAFLASELHAP